jgi:hypothetical protein
MFCIHCGAPNPEDASFCSTCGKAIGALANPPTAAEASQPAPSYAENQFGNAGAPTFPPITLPAQPATQSQYLPAAAAKGKPVLWILAGFAACLLILITVALGSRLSQPSSAPEASREIAVPEPAPAAAPVTYTPPATATSTDNTPAPTSGPVQPQPPPLPAAPQNPLVGDWKTTTSANTTIEIHFGADGRYKMTALLIPDDGVYVYSAGDGTLRLQSSSFFSKGVMIWSCQLSGDTFSCVDPDGAGHVYTRQ